MRRKKQKIMMDAWGIWWWLFFLGLMVISYIPSVIFSLEISLINRATICAAFAWVLDIIFIKIIFPNLSKHYKAYNSIMNELNYCGMSEQLKNRMVEQYNICARKPNDYYMYMMQYSMQIAAYYSDIYEDFATAYQYLDSVNLSQAGTFGDFLKYVEVKSTIIHYYLVKLQIECDANDRCRADRTYQKIMQFCEKYQCWEEFNNMKVAELVLGSYNVLIGNCQNVINKLEATEYDDKVLIVSRFSVLAKAYTKLGDFSRALSMWEQALNNINEKMYITDKEVILREMSKLKKAMGNNTLDSTSTVEY